MSGAREGGRLALIIVDVQHDFVSGSMAIPFAPEIVPVINALQSQLAIDEVVVATDWHTPDHCSFRKTHQHPAARGL